MNFLTLGPNKKVAWPLLIAMIAAIIYVAMNLYVKGEDLLTLAVITMVLSIVMGILCGTVYFFLDRLFPIRHSDR